MTSVTIKAGDTEVLELLALKPDATPLTGSTNLRVDVRRASDDLILDFGDGVFKASGWATPKATLLEVSAANAPGWYKYSLATAGWSTGAYVLTFTEVSTTSAGMLPAAAELRVGGSIADLSARLPPALDGGFMPSKVAAVANGAIDAAAFAAGAITSTVLADDAITGAKIANGSITATEAPALANLDVAVSTRAQAGDAVALTADERNAVADALLDRSLSGHTTAGTAGKALSNVDAAISTLPSAAANASAVWATALPGSFSSGQAGNVLAGRAAPGDAMALVADAVSAAAVSTAGAAKVAGAVLDEPLGTHTTPGTGGVALSRIDATVTSRAATGAAMALTSGERNAVASVIDGLLTTNHGSGNWITATGFAVAGDAMALTPGERTAVASASAAATAPAVWATAVGTPASGTFGWYVRRLFQAVFNRQELALTGGGRITFYDDDSATPICTVDLRDVANNAIVIPATTPARRAKAVFA